MVTWCGLLSCDGYVYAMIDKCIHMDPHVKALGSYDVAMLHAVKCSFYYTMLQVYQWLHCNIRVCLV